ncbi:MAG: PilZ domain-containing protein [Leptospiraceae bacterium]|nr:PilZ domain-containing protein [Leptospiraceae bacterium]
MEEKRKYPRVKSNFSLEVKPSQSGAGFSHNVSEGGLLFEHQGPLPVDGIIDLTLRVPGLSGTTQVKAKVVRCEPSQGETCNVAVNFVDIDNESSSAIRDWLESF